MNQQLRILTWNVERGRSHTEVRARVEHLAQDHDWLLLQETEHYQQLLSDLPGFWLIGFDEAPEQAESCMLVRAGLSITGAHPEKVTDHGWRTVLGRPHPALWVTVATVAGITAASVHTPPSQQTALLRLATPSRNDAYRQEMRHLGGLGLELAGGDWNVSARSDNGHRDDWPQATFARAGLTRVAPRQGTHGFRTIDYFGLGHGLHVLDHKVLPTGGSDHNPFSITIERRRRA